MNEKIRQLAEAAGFYIDSEPIINDSNNPRLEKFAELIVGECADVCRREWLAGSSVQRYGDQCADSIEYHFNIKETV